MPKTIAALLVALSISSSLALATSLDYPLLARTKPNEARAKITALPRDERVDALKQLLRSRQGSSRAMGAMISRSTLETRVLPDLERALTQTKNPPTSKTLGQAIAFLSVYEKIALTDDEMTSLFPDEETATTRLDWIGPVALIVTVLDSRGEPLSGAQVTAYSQKFSVRAPQSAFATADDKGRVTLEVARGEWTILAMNPKTYQGARPGRGVFIVERDLALDQRTKMVELRPDSEITVSIEGALDASAIHAIERSQAYQIPFPSLGRSEENEFILETTKGEPLTLLGVSQADFDDTAWTDITKSVTAPASITWRPTAADVAKISFTRPKHFSSIETARANLRRFIHAATVVALEPRPGMILHAPPGDVVINHSIITRGKRYNYSPTPHALNAGETLSHTLDAPTTAAIYHQVFNGFYGMKNVLGAGVVAQDANGAFLTGIRAPKTNRPIAVPLTVHRNGEVIRRIEGRDGKFFRDIVDEFDAEQLDELEYEIGFDLGRAIPKRIRGSERVTAETEHFTVHAAPLFIERAHAAGLGAERLYDLICELRGSKPKWDHMGLFIETTLPPSVGAQATGRGVRFRTGTLYQGRFPKQDGIWALPHEMLHRFGFGHDDFMSVWCNEILRRQRETDVPNAPYLQKPKIQKDILAILRGEAGDTAAANLGWIVHGLHGLRPFQGYQDVEKEWKPRIQAHGLNDDETYCAILSEKAGADFRPLYAAAGAAVRMDVYAKGLEEIERLKNGEAAVAETTTANTSLATTQTLRRLNTTLGRALKQGEQGVKNLRKQIALVENIDVNRNRVRFYMRFGKAFGDLGAKSDSHDAYHRALLEAARVSRQYVSKCARLATDAMMGKPLMLGHL